MSKIFLFLCLLSNLFSYDDFSYSLDVSEHNLTVKEPMILSLKLQQIKQNEVISFDFHIPRSPLYEVHLIDSGERKDNKGRVHITAKYLFYPLKSGSLTLKPYIIVKRASQEELKKFVTGSADELMYMQTKNKKIILNPITLSVKKIAKEVALVGEYKLICKTDKENVLPNEQVNMACILSGKRYKPELSTLFSSKKGMSVFEDINREDKKLFHKVTFDYALSAEENFTIPKITLDGYNPFTKKYYILDVPAKVITVAKQAFVEKEDTTKENSLPYKMYLNYLLLFVAGYLLQRLFRNVSKPSLGDDVRLKLRIKQCKTAKELLHYLLTQDTKRFQKQIDTLEQIIYHDSPLSFKKIQKELS